MYFKLSKLFGLISCWIVLLLVSCESNQDNSHKIVVSNNTAFLRNNESIEIWLDQVDSQLSKKEGFKLFDINGNLVLSQLVDVNSDSIYDYLLFQTNIEAYASKEFSLVKADIVESINFDHQRTYCKSVPERMDDFAWENDRVAFRTYGPECQRLFETGNPTGLISSGIDCWLKRVNYPIIDKWYENYKNGISYHTDYGEGLDNYHVGTTRGCGGTALICEEKKVLSGNFYSCKIIANGPIRTIFELNYEPIDMCGKMVSEKKMISIDLGSHFYHCNVIYSSKGVIKKSAVGIALHKGKGNIGSNKNIGWISYWEPLDDSFLGTGILVDNTLTLEHKLDAIIHDDESKNNITVEVKLIDNKFDYWAGFGWRKQGDFLNENEWHQHLNETAKKIQNPLKILITKN